MNTRKLLLLFALGGLALGGIFVVSVTVMPYWKPELPGPEPRRVNWTSYRDDAIGYAFDVPARYKPQSAGASVLFRFDGAALLHVAWLDEAASKRRGLWPGHPPVGEIELGGRAGKKYVYNHYDFVVGVRTHSWVVPHRGKFLAMEFRTRRASVLEEFGIRPQREAEPGEVSRRILASFRFLDPPTAARTDDDRPAPTER